MAELMERVGEAGVPCATCGSSVAVHERIPATFCMQCGCCVLNPGDGRSLPPLVPPLSLEEGAWKALAAEMLDGERASRRRGRLLFVPWHEWEPDLTRRRLVKDARAVLSPAADLLPAGLRPASAPLGDDVRGLRIAEAAHKGRLADPRQSLDLIRQGEAVDVMVPPFHPAPRGAAGGAMPRLIYYPFWIFTYAVDHKERVGAVDAVNGRPVGASQAPRRWAPALRAAISGLAVFAAVQIALAFVIPAPAAAALAGALSWGAAFLALGAGISRERGR